MTFVHFIFSQLKPAVRITFSSMPKEIPLAPDFWHRNLFRVTCLHKGKDRALSDPWEVHGGPQQPGWLVMCPTAWWQGERAPDAMSSSQKCSGQEALGEPSPFRWTGTSLSAAQCPKASGTLQGHAMCCCAADPAWFFPGDLKLISLAAFSWGGEIAGRQAA